MAFLLRIKAWLLFILIILPLVFQILTIITVGFTFAAGEGAEQDEYLFETIIFAAITIISALASFIILFSWLYLLATGLYRKLPQGHNLKIGRFKFAFFYPFIYLLILAYCVFLIAQSDSPMWVLVIIPFHFLAIACMLYVFYFTAKSLKTVELQRTVKFGDYAGEFFLIWFYLIGVWIIQPRVNTIFANPDETSEYGGPVDRYMK